MFTTISHRIIIYRDPSGIWTHDQAFRGLCFGPGEWNEKRLVLQLEHINGDAYDNRLDNLCFLCPNCHSQTDSYNRKKINKIKRIKKIEYCECGKEITCGAYMCVDCYSKTNRIVERPTHEQLKKEIKETSQNKVAKKYNVSWRTIRKWLKYYEKLAG
jgi:hypothetical protein